VRPLLDQPNVTLLVDAQVQRPETDPAGRSVTSVYEGDIVAVAAGAANSAAILLRSASDRHPESLAKGSGQVGRNYMYHNSKAVVALGKERNDTAFEKTLGLNDFYFAGDGREWPLGNIQMCGRSKAEAMKGEEPKLTKLS
jgi:choline dehydrogenase-like flavoprotein